MKFFTASLLALFLFLLSSKQNMIVAQNWQLMWADEFTTSISDDWTPEIGTGSNGWGNNELQYYRSENLSVENGELVITAKKEAFGGMDYTSARMITKDKSSWRYGKIEARIKMPAFTGVWPAFWMLGDNIGTVGWPNCGEIDIMEHINTEAKVYGTVHLTDENNNYAYIGNNISIDPTQYHIYSIEWDDQKIQWFVDGTFFHEVTIANNVNGTSEFHHSFFIILNLAIGGNWPGFTVDQNAFPATMNVDYIRVYQDPTLEAYNNYFIEAENYSAMNGVINENTDDINGGRNVGTIDAGDWMIYSNVLDLPETGNYLIEYRVASLNGGGKFKAELNAGATLLDILDVPKTDGWQNWVTISHEVTLEKGKHNFGLNAVTGGWNINWINISKVKVATHVEDDVLVSKLLLSPNPVNSVLHLSHSGKALEGEVSICDAAGKMIYKTFVPNGRLDVSGFQPGLYFLTVTYDIERQRFKLVIE